MRKHEFALCLVVVMGCGGGDPDTALGDPDAAANPCDMAEACTPGTVRYEKVACGEGLYQPQTCSDTCGWVATAECIDPCASARRPAPHDDAQEVCVPAGYFMRGADTPLFDNDKGSMPMREVWVSTYLVDKYPVTIRRYKQCMAAKVCERPLDVHSDDILSNPFYEQYPITSTKFLEAEAFCKWDGKKLTTEAEWEKAARGPAPRSQPYTWEGTEYRCDLLPHWQCEGYTEPFTTLHVDRYNDLPGTRSYYGAEMMLGGDSDWVSDFFAEKYYATRESHIDPGGPAEATIEVLYGEQGPVGVLRGRARVSMDPRIRVTTRFKAIRTSVTPSIHGGSIRCTRLVEKE